MKEFIEKLIGRLEEAEKCNHEKALEEIMENGHTMDAEGFLNQEDAFNKAIEIVNELAEEYNNGWIPCSERLPEEHDSIFAEVKGTDKWRDGMFEKTSDDVNVTVKYENGTVKTKTMRTIDGKWNIDSVLKCEVTHWQPLPAAPYQEGK